MRAWWSLQLCGLIAIGVATARAQAPPPIHGFTGTIATEATIKSEQKAANKIVVVTDDGVEHVYDAAKGLVVHGGKDKGALADLKPGTTVVIHYTPDNTAQEIDRVGAGGLSTTEGIATKIDRDKKEITVRYDNGKVEKLKLTDRAASEVATKVSPDTRIIVYYSDEAAGRVAHYFKTKQ